MWRNGVLRLLAGLASFGLFVLPTLSPRAEGDPRGTSAAAAVAPGQPVAAPTPAPVALPRVRLSEFPPWLGPDGMLRIGLEITNRGEQPIVDPRIGISIFDGPRSRSELSRSFKGGRLARQLRWSDTLVSGVTIPPFSTGAITVEKPLSEISFFGSAEDRVYPMWIVVRTGAVPIPPVETELIYFARAPSEPLRVALVIPLDAPPVFDPEGRMIGQSLGNAIAGGRLTRILEALDAHPDVPVTLAPSGLLTDSLADAADGYAVLERSRTGLVEASDPPAQAAAAALERMRVAVRRPGTRIIAPSYSNASLPALVRADLADQVRPQVEETRSRLRYGLGFDPLPGWFLPAGGLLDEPTLALLQRLEVSQLILSPVSIRPARQAPTLTPGNPVGLRTRIGAVRAVVEDATLASRLTPEEGVGPIQARQRLLAETATIMLERPAQGRGVTLVAPQDWSADPTIINGLLDALARSPWMVGRTPDQLLSELSNGRTEELASSETVMKAGPEAPGREYFDALRSARRAIDRYADLVPPTEISGPLGQIHRSFLAAQSTDLWGRAAGGRDASFARLIESKVKTEFSKIRAPASQTITLTSRRGKVPLVIQSRVDYPVEVLIRLESDKLTFPGGRRCPVGPPASVCFPVTLQPRAQTVEVRANAQATGTFPLRVTLLTSRQGLTIDSRRLVVRSTAYNMVALAITGGAAAYLVGSWLGGLLRRRVTPRAAG
ncbi:MAG: DUF6049 family protein [Actinomycetota bacterium]